MWSEHCPISGLKIKLFMTIIIMIYCLLLASTNSSTFQSIQIITRDSVVARFDLNDWLMDKQNFRRCFYHVVCYTVCQSVDGESNRIGEGKSFKKREDCSTISAVQPKELERSHRY